ncbi:MAG: T9SS type A sorting domain-containing protein, partial [Bacteroidales bacterium]|nr:T9SS type A sorting domain-containing protein [Bacteroidales bacterium]
NWVVYPIETGTITPTDNNLSIDWDIAYIGETGIYVEATNICGFSRSDTLFVQTNPSPFPNLGNDTTICAGETLMLDAGFANGWNWSNGEITQTIEVSEQGLFSVEPFIGTCSNQDEIYVTLSDPDVEFGQDTIYSDVPITLDAGAGFVEYLWNDNSTDQTLEAINSGWYYVTVTNEFGCMDNDSVYFDFVSDINLSNTDIEIYVYPNPTNGVFVVEVNVALNDIIKVKVFNSLGQIIESVESIQEVIEIDISNHIPGLYFIRIHQNGNVWEYKLSKH